MRKTDKKTEFDSRSDALLQAHRRARALLRQYNGPENATPEERADMLEALLGQTATGVWIEPPFFCDYGRNIFVGEGVFANFNCVFLDGARITIGAGTLIGPAVQIYATGHPLKAEDRVFRRDNGCLGYHSSAQPVTIGKNAWIGGGAIIQPGVTIGDGTTIGAGSVVTKDIPANVFAAGNPCKAIRDL